MSDDDYFDDELDSAFLNAVDAIEAAHVPPAAAAASAIVPGSHSTSRPSSSTSITPSSLSGSKLVLQSSYSAPKPSSSRAPPADVIELDDSSDYGDLFDDVVVDDAALAKIDELCRQEYSRNGRGNGQTSAQPVAGPSKPNGLARRSSKGAQLNLFGEVATEREPPKGPAQSTRQPFQRTRSRQMPLPGQARKTKKWDRTAYAKTGWRKPKPNPDRGLKPSWFQS